ncbi:diguanylate cyclase [Jiella sp. M17.18]|uniref:diguanylate cyclase n=1 Tax=Jiella sp. M17.18 TaxID=3234247 RepID=UPI0034DEEE21
MSLPDFTLAIVNDLGIFALVTMCYGSIIRNIRYAPEKGAVIGLMFGAGAALAMADGVEFAPGILVDARAVMLALVCPFGGPWAAFVAAGVTSTVRLWIGGPSADVGVVNICSTVAIGMAFARVAFRPGQSYTTGQFVWLGAVANLPFALILAAPVAKPARVFLQTIGPISVATLVGVVVLGKFLSRERAAIRQGRVLEADASTDPLTELPNRRKLERKSVAIIESAQRSGKPVSVLIIDSDHFKSMNDRYGHDVGDVLLKEVADVVSANVRPRDALARYGGEEIVVLMPETGAAAASVVAERVRRLVDFEVFHGDRGTGNVTVSIGVASDQGPAVSFKRLFKAADEALYVAKDRGRNRVEMAPPVTLPVVA